LLTEFLGIQISKTLNCSEAVAKGCAWQCARLSPLFHVRSFTVQSCNLYDIHTEFVWNTSESGKLESNVEIDQIIFPSQALVPSNKLITIPKTNFDKSSTLVVNLSYNQAKEQDVPNPTNKKHENENHFAKFTIANIPANGENSSKSSIKVGLKMSSSGLCTLSKVYKEYTETITYEAEEEVPITETENNKEEQKMDTSSENSNPENKEEQKMDTTSENTTTETKKEENKTETKKEEPKKEEPKKEEVKKRGT